MTAQKGKIGNLAVALTVSKMITLIISIATSMLLSRSLSLNDYGTYSELQTVTALVVSIFALGLPNSLNYFLPTFDKERRNKFIGLYFTAITVISVIVGIVMFAGKGGFAKYYKNNDIIIYSFFLTIIPWTKIAVSSRSNMLIVDSKVKKEFIYCISNALCLLLITALMTVVGGSFKTYLILYVFIEVVFGLLVYCEAYISADRKLKPDLDFKLIKTILVFSVPLGLSTAVSTISLDLDKLIIGYFMDEKAVAVYANAGKELPFSYISSSFTAVILPQIVKRVKENNTERAIEIWKKSSEICFIVLSFCTAACIVFAPQIITVLYSEKYLGGVGIFRIYSLVLLTRITYWGMILNAYGKTKQIFYNSVYCLIINIVSSVGLYFLIGFEGPAAATLISILFMATIQLFHSSRLSGKNFGKVFPWLEMLKEALVCLITAGIAFAAVKFLNLGTDTRSIFIAVLIGCIWLAIFVLLSFKRVKRLWQNI